MMRLQLTSILVDDQEKALAFYTDILGFVKQTEIPMGEVKWLTVISPGHPEIELVLEPCLFGPAKTYQKELYDANIPANAFSTDDIQAEYERLEKLGVSFKTPPTEMGGVKIAVFSDTCGNLIQIYQT